MADSSPNQAAFVEACVRGNLDAVQKFLDQDPSLSKATGLVREDHREFMGKQGAEGGWPVLHLAAHYGQEHVLKCLIKAGAELDRVSENREANTALMAAVAGRQARIVKILLEAGADPALPRDDLNARTLAQQEGTEEIKALLKTF